MTFRNSGLNHLLLSLLDDNINQYTGLSIVIILNLIGHKSLETLTSSYDKQQHIYVISIFKKRKVRKIYQHLIWKGKSRIYVISIFVSAKAFFQPYGVPYRNHVLPNPCKLPLTNFICLFDCWESHLGSNYKPSFHCIFIKHSFPYSPALRRWFAANIEQSVSFNSQSAWKT